jgi:hypothetical protein
VESDATSKVRPTHRMNRSVELDSSH